jgi:gluconolactonase
MSEVEVLVEGLGCPEGPDLLSDGRLVFVETFRCRVSAWDPDNGLRTYAKVGGAPNACLAGLDGVYVTQHGSSAGGWRSPEPTTASIQRIRPDGGVEFAVTSADGSPLVGPNDLSFGPEGHLYFTDPGRADPEDPEEGQICVVDPGGTATVLEKVGPSYPNGIVAEPDGSVVWDETFTRQVKRRRPDGSVVLLATLPEDRILDGIKLAENGDLYVTGATSGGIDILSPAGDVLDFIRTGGTPLNCIFDDTDLYVADYGDAALDDEEGEGARSGRLLRLQLEAAGQPLYRGTVRSQAQAEPA